MRSSFPHLLPDLSRDFTSGSSLFLTTLRSAPPVSSAPLAPPSASVPPPPGFPPRALFESFFAPAAQATPSVQLNWFDRVRTSLFEADSRVASLLSSGRPERLVVPTRAPSYAVKGDCALGHAVPVNESLLSHFDRPLRPSLQLGLTICDAMTLEASSCAQSVPCLC